MVAIRLILASLALAGLTGAAPLQPRQTCYSGVYMIVARGSDEDPGEGVPGLVANAVQAQLPNSGSVAVNYPASIFDPPYPTSVGDGVTNTISLIQNYVKACGSKSKIALIGYSQGGNVMTDTLAGGVAKPSPISSAYSKYSMWIGHWADEY
jgi:acetylxylan esterase